MQSGLDYQINVVNLLQIITSHKPYLSLCCSYTLPVHNGPEYVGPLKNTYHTFVADSAYFRYTYNRLCRLLFCVSTVDYNEDHMWFHNADPWTESFCVNGCSNVGIVSETVFVMLNKTYVM